MNKKIAGCVLLYKPDSSVRQNIFSYLPYLDKLFLIDNTDRRDLNTVNKELAGLDKVVYVGNNSNLGVAAGLNTAAHLAIRFQYDWLLTMDQDSFFTEPMAAAYFDCFKKIPSLKDAAIVAPSYSRTDSTPAAQASCDYREEWIVLTSGNLLNLRLYPKIGGFEEKLFIDEVDHDYCLKARLLGCKVLQFKRIYLKHQIGKLYSIKVGRKIREFCLHDATRLYYMARNNLYIWKKYRRDFPEFMKKKQRAFWLRVIPAEAIFLPHRGDRIFHILRGIFDFLRGKFGKAVLP